MPDDDALCLNGLQHDFVMTSWNTEGATSSFANELMCPTCSTLLYREDARDPWQWSSAADSD